MKDLSLELSTCPRCYREGLRECCCIGDIPKYNATERKHSRSITAEEIQDAYTATTRSAEERIRFGWRILSGEEHDL